MSVNKTKMRIIAEKILRITEECSKEMAVLKIESELIELDYNAEMRGFDSMKEITVKHLQEGLKGVK